MTLIFWGYPIIKSLLLAFQTTSGPHSARFVGIANFAMLFQDAELTQAARNTLCFVVASVTLQVAGSLALAFLMQGASRSLRGAVLWTLLIPNVTGAVFAPLLFQFALADNGWLNQVLATVGIKPWQWLKDPDLVMPAVVFISFWLGLGFNTLMVLASLESVDRATIEAARLDGASELRTFWHVSLPQVRSTVMLIATMSAIGSVRVFELPWLLLKKSAGPDGSGQFIVTCLYRNGFEAGDLGYASAIGWGLTVAVVALTYLSRRLTSST